MEYRPKIIFCPSIFMHGFALKFRLQPFTDFPVKMYPVRRFIVAEMTQVNNQAIPLRLLSVCAAKHMMSFNPLRTAAEIAYPQRPHSSHINASFSGVSVSMSSSRHSDTIPSINVDISLVS